MQKTPVLIYQDYVHNNGPLYAALADRYGHGAVGYCDASDILAGALDRNVRLFAMPGGADLYFCEKLNGEGNARIRAYVENGGSYLGICAGAYYACAAIEWAKGTDQEICGPRELAFYDGTAIGPVPEFLQERPLTGSWLHAAPLLYQDGPTIFETKVVYEGGPVFSGDAGNILARYQNGKAAIVECSIGRGRIILSSPHIERLSRDTLYRHNNPDHAREQAVMDELAPHAAQRARLWNIILDRLSAEAKEQSSAA